MTSNDYLTDRLEKVRLKQKKGAKSVTDATKTRQILELLKDRHAGSEWACFAELNIGTGGNGGRWIDFFAFNLWPSQRLLKIAYEIKVSRADFAKELSNPLKREDAEKLADECWFVTPVGLVRVDEIPEGWGLIEMVANGLRVKKRAKQRKVEELPLSFVASIARRSEHHTPSLPKALWLCAGRELDEETVLQVIQERFATETAQIESAAQEKAWEAARERYKTEISVTELIRNRIGWRYSIDPQALSQWFDENLVSGPVELDGRMKEKLQQLQRSISAILGEDR